VGALIDESKFIAGAVRRGARVARAASTIVDAGRRLCGVATTAPRIKERFVGRLNG
jgi:hypothetical protein|tara:strand:- start:8558 stop:8725 length:168 start_codon:yes stop_codon:yes gene_type:complete